MTDTSAQSTDEVETLIEQLQGPNGAALRDRLKQSLDALQARLKAQEQRGVSPDQIKLLSAALLAVTSAHGTLNAIQVGSQSSESPLTPQPQKGQPT